MRREKAHGKVTNRMGEAEYKKAATTHFRYCKEMFREAAVARDWRRDGLRGEWGETVCLQGKGSVQSTDRKSSYRVSRYDRREKATTASIGSPDPVRIQRARRFGHGALRRRRSNPSDLEGHRTICRGGAVCIRSRGPLTRVLDTAPSLSASTCFIRKEISPPVGWPSGRTGSPEIRSAASGRPTGTLKRDVPVAVRAQCVLRRFGRIP